MYIWCAQGNQQPINEEADVSWVHSSRRGDERGVFQQREEQISVRFSAASASKKMNASKSETAALF